MKGRDKRVVTDQYIKFQYIEEKNNIDSNYYWIRSEYNIFFR